MIRIILSLDLVWSMGLSFIWRTGLKAFSFLARLRKDQSGAALAYTAILLPAMLGFVGLGIDVALWQSTKRNAQTLVDTAAVAASIQIIRTKMENEGDDPDVDGTVLASALKNGLNLADGDVITINSPPLSGTQVGNDEAVEVIFSRPVPSLFSSVLREGGGNVSARAVAVGDISDTCLWALDPEESGALRISGGAEVSFSCGVFANSVDVEAIQVNGTGSCLTASEVKIVGGSDGICINPEPETGVMPRQDPLGPLPTPDDTGCDHTSITNVNNGDATLSPGTYCADIRINTSGTVTLLPGMYILKGAGMSIGAQATVVGDGVSFYMDPSGGINDNLNFSSGSTIDLSAPTSGLYSGILFHQDPASNEDITHNITGGANMNLDGILYFPNNEVKFAGGSEAEATELFMIARAVDFTGNSYIAEMDPDSKRSYNPLFVETRLVE